MRIRTILPTTVLVFSLAALAFAHGGKVHVQGTVTKVNASSITVKAPDGKSTEVKLVASTAYILHSPSADQPAKAADVAVGDLVVIHATPKNDTLEADEVKFSVPAKVAGNPKILS
jgi:phytoene dehydrogenase-like protein